MNEHIEVMICDDQDIVREGLKTILETDPKIRVTGSAENGAALFSLLERTETPDLILMDLKMPEMNGIQTTHKLHVDYPEVRVLVLTTYDDDEWVMDAVRAGACGYLLKDTSRIDLIDAVKGSLAGQNFVDPGVAGKVLAMAADTQPRYPLSSFPDIRPRERRILLLMSRGCSNAEIADDLELTEGTLRNYASVMFTRMGVTDRTQAAVTALRHGIIRLDEI